MAQANSAPSADWAPRTIGGTAYGFEHLRPFEMHLRRPATAALAPLEIPIRVVFDCHVVTQACSICFEHVAGHPAYWVDSGGHCRVFRADRHAQSLELPNFIRSLLSGRVKCYAAKSSNFMAWKAVADTTTQHYQVYFVVYRPRGADHLVLYVQSAYVKQSPLPAQRESRRVFATLCAQAFGAIAHHPKGRTSKSKKLKP
jgi:hypothetical protein